MTSFGPKIYAKGITVIQKNNASSIKTEDAFIIDTKTEDTAYILFQHDDSRTEPCTSPFESASSKELNAEITSGYKRRGDQIDLTFFRYGAYC